MNPELIWPSLVTVLATIVYFVTGLNVGRARTKHKISPPQMTGDPNFERVVRVHQNTLENLVMFLPILWLFSLWVNPFWGAGIGVFWMLGRILYAQGYYQAVEKRSLGFGISLIATVILLIGTLIGLVLPLLKTTA